MVATHIDVRCPPSSAARFETMASIDGRNTTEPGTKEPPARLRRRPASRIAIVLFDGFDELDAIGPFEVLSPRVRAHPFTSIWSVRPGPARSRRATVCASL